MTFSKKLLFIVVGLSFLAITNWISMVTLNWRYSVYGKEALRGINEAKGMGKVIRNRYRYQQQFSSGTHAKVYVGTDIITKDKVAVKIEPVNNRQLFASSEGAVLQALQGGEGIPVLKWFGRVGEHSIIITELLGSDFKKIVDRKTLNMRSILLIADQLISRLEYIHSKGYLHRDIFPRNVVIGLGVNCNTIYVIDFGTSSPYQINGTNEHIPYGLDSVSFNKYASLNRNRGVRGSRRDDMESIGYSLLYLLRKKLPWIGQGYRQPPTRNSFLSIKANTSIKDLCQGLPIEFGMYMEYVRALEFEATPDYSFLRKLFKDVFIRKGFSGDDLFE